MQSTLAQRLQQPDAVGLTDWQAAQLLNQPDQSNGTTFVPLQTADVRLILTTSGAWTGCDQFLESNNPSPSTVNAVRRLFDVATLNETLGQSNANSILSILQTLVTAGLVTPQARSEIEGKTQRPMSWSEANGIAVDARAVGLARGGR